MLADVFFKANKLSSTGALVIGIFSNLGKTDIGSLNSSSDGIKQLLEFQPPEKKEEIAKQYSILKRGVQVGNNIYKFETEIKEDNVYVLRSVAYKGKIFKGEGTDKINLLETDERKDITVVFKILRQLDDGSLILLWKVISRIAPPKINLEMKSKDNNLPKKNEFTK